MVYIDMRSLEEKAMEKQKAEMEMRKQCFSQQDRSSGTTILKEDTEQRSNCACEDIRQETWNVVLSRHFRESLGGPRRAGIAKESEIMRSEDRLASEELNKALKSLALENVGENRQLRELLLEALQIIESSARLSKQRFRVKKKIEEARAWLSVDTELIREEYQLEKDQG